MYWFDSHLVLTALHRFPRGLEALDFSGRGIKVQRDGIRVVLIKTVRSIPLLQSCQSGPLGFSLLGRCHGLSGSGHLKARTVRCERFSDSKTVSLPVSRAPQDRSISFQSYDPRVEATRA